MIAPPPWLRTAQLGDGATLAALGAADADAWTVGQFAQELSVGVSHTWVATQPPEPSGTAPATVMAGIVFWHVADELQVLNLLVHGAWRRQGFGARLLAAAVAAARAAGCTAAWLEVRADNAPAIALYVRAGFVATGRRRTYYAGSGADALLMARPLTVNPHR